MLRKVIRIQNTGCFRDSRARNVPEWSKYTLISAENGHGKSTVSAILRSLSEGEPGLVLGRRRLGEEGDPLVELLFSTSGSPVKFDQGTWSEDMPNLEIFDGVFVDRNVHTGESVSVENRRNLYQVIIGAVGVELAASEADLAARSRRQTEKITEGGNRLRGLIPNGIQLDAFLEFDTVADVESKVEAQSALLDAMTKSDEVLQRPLLPVPFVPKLPEALLQNLSRTIDTIASDAEATIAEHLAAHNFEEGGSAWVVEGLRHTPSDQCPFCGNSLKGLGLISAYRAVFSQQYQEFQAELHDMHTDIEDSIGQSALHSLLNYATELDRGVDFWERFCDLDKERLILPENVSDVMSSMVQACRLLLEHKQALPAQAVEPDQTFVQARHEFARLQQQLKEVADAVEVANDVIGLVKANASTPAIYEAQSELLRLKACAIKQSEPANTLCEDYIQLKADKVSIELEKEKVREQLTAHTSAVVEPLEARVNELLVDFNASFQIANTTHRFPGGRAASSYQLLINGTPVDIGDSGTTEEVPRFANTLSSGDRTTLALAFFLACLEQDPNLQDKIVIFDDPFGSQDAFRRRQTAYEILKIGRRCNQVIVLSHDPHFLRKIWDRAEGGERVSLWLPTSDEGSKIEALDLEGATDGRFSREISRLQAFLSLNQGDSLEVARLLRPVFETYSRYRFPLDFNGDDNLGEMIKKTRQGGPEHPAVRLLSAMELINEYVETHHGDPLTRGRPTEVNRTELRGNVRRLLKVLHGKSG